MKKSVGNLIPGRFDTHAIFWLEGGDKRVLQYEPESRVHKECAAVNHHEELNRRPRKFRVCKIEEL